MMRNMMLTILEPTAQKKILLVDFFLFNLAIAVLAPFLVSRSETKFDTFYATILNLAPVRMGMKDDVGCSAWVWRDHPTAISVLMHVIFQVQWWGSGVMVDASDLDFFCPTIARARW